MLEEQLKKIRDQVEDVTEEEVEEEKKDIEQALNDTPEFRPKSKHVE